MSVPNAANVLNGPAYILKDDEQIGHTQGGITGNVSPQTRFVQVDQFGNSELALVHVGETCRVTVPLTEWADDSLAELLPSGFDGGNYWGFGRTAGTLQTPFDLKVTMFNQAVYANKFLQLYAAVSMGQFNLPFNNQGQTIAEAQYAGLIDETALIEEDNEDGDLIGRLQFAAASP